MFDKWEGDISNSASDVSQVIAMSEPHQVAGLFRLNPELDQVAHSMELQKGWNMVSLPIYADYMEIDANLLNQTIGHSWTWDENGYISDDNLATKTGYWLFCNKNCLVNLNGVLDEDNVLNLSPGWILAGIGADGMFSSVEHLHNTIWFWDSRAQQFRAVNSDTLLTKGKAYWIYGKGSGSTEVVFP